MPRVLGIHFWIKGSVDTVHGRPSPIHIVVELVVTAAVKPRFLLVEPGDVGIFPTVEAMASYVESYDVAGYEFFDANGARLVSNVDGYKVNLVPDLQGAPEPSHLEDALRSYFTRLSPSSESYSTAATEARSLEDLVELRWQFEQDSQRHRQGWGLRRFFGLRGVRE